MPDSAWKDGRGQGSCVLRHGYGWDVEAAQKRMNHVQDHWTQTKNCTAVVLDQPSRLNQNVAIHSRR